MSRMRIPGPFLMVATCVLLAPSAAALGGLGIEGPQHADGGTLVIFRERLRMDDDSLVAILQSAAPEDLALAFVAPGGGPDEADWAPVADSVTTWNVSGTARGWHGHANVVDALVRFRTPNGPLATTVALDLVDEGAGGVRMTMRVALTPVVVDVARPPLASHEPDDRVLVTFSKAPTRVVGADGRAWLRDGGNWWAPVASGESQVKIVAEFADGGRVNSTVDVPSAALPESSARVESPSGHRGVPAPGPGLLVPMAFGCAAARRWARGMTETS